MTTQRLTFLLILAAVVLGPPDGSATETLSPTELVASTPKGQLKNAFSPEGAAAKEGYKI
jgi:hypothetical protein